MRSPQAGAGEDSGKARERPAGEAIAVTPSPGSPPPRTPTVDALPPALAAALASSDSLQERLEHIAALSPTRPRYTLLGEIAEGGMGRILRVWDEVLQRELAMKTVQIAARSDSSEEEQRGHQRLLARFIEEARITGQLDHPGIVPVHEIAVDEEGRVFFTMPLVRGSTLKHVFALVRDEREGWTRHRALDLLHKVCLTVAFAHSRGVIHRDLKPDNVMVGPFGEAYVMDWGLAHIEGRTHGSVVGTPAYMAPEQAAHPEEVDARADVYSLGAILYELLAGAIPHQRTLDERAEASPGESSLEEVLHRTPRPLGELDVDAPAELVAIARKAMEPGPEDRYASARELADDLAAWLEGRVVRAHRSTRWTKVQKWRQRNRGLSRALEALVLVALASTTLIALQQATTIRRVQAANTRSLQSSYAANIHAASLHLRALEMNEALSQLAQCPPELRGWEWDHLQLAADSSVIWHAGDGRELDALAASDDGQRVAAAFDDGEVRIYSGSGELLHAFQAHDGGVGALAFQPGTTLLATGSADRRLRWWNAETGTAVRTHSHGARIEALAFSADGRLVAVGDFEGTTDVRRAANDELVVRFDNADLPVSALAFSPDGEALFVGHSSGHLLRWNVASGVEEGRELLATRPVEALAVSPAGDALYAAVGDQALALNPRRLARLRAYRGHEHQVKGLELDASAHRLLTASTDCTLRLWDVETGVSLDTYTGHVDDVNDVVFLAEEGEYLSVSEDGTLRQWHRGVLAETVVRAHPDWVSAIAFSPDGKSLASTGREGTLAIWDADTAELVHRIPLSSSSDFVGWTPDGRLVFTGEDGGIRLAALDSAAPWEVLTGASRHPAAVAVHRSSGRIVAATVQNTVLGWEPGGTRPAFERDAPESYALAFDAPGGRFALGTQDGRVLLCDARTGDTERELVDGESAINALAFAHQAELLAAGTLDREILIWSTLTGKLLRRARGHESQITSVAFSRDDTRVVSGSLDHTLRIWSIETAESLLTLPGHEMSVTSLAISPSGTTLVSASKDGTLRFHRTERRPSR